MTQCKTCDRREATDDEWRTMGEGEGADLCWKGADCHHSAVDWRARALSLGAALADAVLTRDEARRERDEARRAKAENDDRFMSERDEARIRCREAAEVLIEAVGADGPCDVGDAARRAVAALLAARSELCALLDGHLSPSDAVRAASITRATAARRGWGM